MIRLPAQGKTVFRSGHRPEFPPAASEPAFNPGCEREAVEVERSAVRFAEIAFGARHGREALLGIGGVADGETEIRAFPDRRRVEDPRCVERPPR